MRKCADPFIGRLRPCVWPRQEGKGVEFDDFLQVFPATALQACRQTGSQADRQTGRLAGRQAGRQAVYEQPKVRRRQYQTT